MTIASDDPLEIEEERRLAYVGITRAKEDLTLTCAKSRMLRGGDPVQSGEPFCEGDSEGIIG